jgi:hypothetical protein
MLRIWRMSLRLRGGWSSFFRDAGTDGDPHLDLHRVHRGPVERLDAQALLDPLEEQLDLPPTLAGKKVPDTFREVTA